MASSCLQPLPALLLVMLLGSNAMHAMATDDLIDFYYLVLMWPGAFCKESDAGCCFPKTGAPKLDFFVSGLWPASSDGNPLTDCKNSPFYISKLSDLKEDLHSYWPSIECPSNDGYDNWKSTWETFGVCSGLSQHGYFKKALDLRSKIDLLSIFTKNGIISTDYADYSIEDIKQVIRKGIGARAGLDCSKNMWDESTLSEIFVCFDKDITKIIPCPVSSAPSSCASRVVFGSFTYDMLKNKTSLASNPIRMRRGLV